MNFGFVVARPKTLTDPFERLFRRLPEGVFFTRFIPRLVCLGCPILPVASNAACGLVYPSRTALNFPFTPNEPPGTKGAHQARTDQAVTLFDLGTAARLSWEDSNLKWEITSA